MCLIPEVVDILKEERSNVHFLLSIVTWLMLQIVYHIYTLYFSINKKNANRNILVFVVHWENYSYRKLFLILVYLCSTKSIFDPNQDR